MTSTGIDLYGIVHVKVDFIPGLKMCVLPILGKFVWTTIFDNVWGDEVELLKCIFVIKNMSS